MSASCLASIWPAASPPKIKSATSPGMTRMMTKTSAAAPISVGTIRRRRLATYVPMRGAPRRGSVLGQPDVLELLVGVVIRRGHVVLHFGPVHDVPRPPEGGDVVGVLEHSLLELQDRALPLGGIQRSRLAREQVVDRGVAEPAPVVGVSCGVPLEKHIGIVAGLDGRSDDQLEVTGIAPVRKPGCGLEGPMLGLDPDLAP